MQINLPSVLAAFVGSPINRGGVIKKNPFSYDWERIFYAYEKYHLHCLTFFASLKNKVSLGIAKVNFASALAYHFISPPYNDVGYLPEKHAVQSSER